MGEGLYRCPVHGEQLPGMRPESGLARGQLGHPLPGLRRPARHADDARANLEPAERVRHVEARRRDGRRQSRTPLRRPDGRAPVQHRAGPTTVGLQRVLRCVSHLLPSYLQGSAPTLYEDGQRCATTSTSTTWSTPMFSCSTTIGPPAGCSTSGAGAQSRPGSSPTSSCGSTAPTNPGVVTGEFRFGDTRHIFSDICALRGLGWEPRRRPPTRSRPTPSGSRKCPDSRASSTTRWNDARARSRPAGAAR